MKQVSLFVLILSSLFLSCSKQEVGDFQLEYRMSLELPANANPLFTHVFEKNIASSWIQFLKANNLEDSDIRMVRPRSVILSPAIGNNLNYENFVEAHVSVYDFQDPGGILQIGDLYEIIGSQDELIFLPGLANVKDIIRQAEFILKLEFNVRAIPGSLTEHYLIVQFDVFRN
ncbi:MAG: hypothetical protein IPL31_13380 [Saprospiraceae bacterium]|nr:hypothetical protein [Saprospiraceae bacterium]MBK8485291.1 hypothetical protein [Saprospiraceae bacterium]